MWIIFVKFHPETPYSTGTGGHNPFFVHRQTLFENMKICPLTNPTNPFLEQMYLQNLNEIQ